jgi:hypothetical protein
MGHLLSFLLDTGQSNAWLTRAIADAVPANESPVLEPSCWSDQNIFVIYQRKSAAEKLPTSEIPPIAPH